MGTLVLDNANSREATVEIALPDLLGIDELCPRTNPPPASMSIMVGVRPDESTGGSAGLPVKVSYHDLSLATTTIKDAGEIVPKEITSEEEFLRKEGQAYRWDVQAGYVQDGTARFTDMSRIVCQYPENRARLTIDQQPIPLSTVLVDELSQRIFAEKLTEFLSLATQELTNSSGDELDFDGPYGTYYQEIFFHIPFLIAHHLNANQKFKEAKWWYERIFDPTASELPDPNYPTNRYWRYRKFRVGMGEAVTKLRDVLVQSAAIEEYKRDPFNPHAIARLRTSAYQKAIVMRYIDNLLDWGDYLFAQDSTESINEATMLYVLAADILGRRPTKLGKCDTEKNEIYTYERIGPCIGEDSEFLIVLENWLLTMSTPPIVLQFTTISKLQLASANATSPTALAGDTGRPLASAIIGNSRLSDSNLVYTGMPYGKAAEKKSLYASGANTRDTMTSRNTYPSAGLGRQAALDVEHVLAFCSPPNHDLLAYWDRVEDRLFKIRHCMNISGVRRQLALFQPPINPALLVRARAAGLSLEDILAMLAAPLPPYRFSYLVEKAKQFTQTVQSFGGALLSALEKKDVEELTLLRSVHERNILRMTKEIKKKQVQEAQYQYQAMVETKANVQNRVNYYQELVGEGLTAWEITQQVSKHLATQLRIAESGLHIAEAVAALLPNVGSPFSINYGGRELSKSAEGWAVWAQTLASILNEISASAGLEATFQRREQEWKQQLLLAQQELKQVEQQRLAAEIRQLITEQDLATHEKSMEQADELHEFYKDKFTNLGLYNYLSTTLNRLYREAYNVAYDLAKMAERTYQFERDDETLFIAADNWQFDRAGLLAGERLLLQLQRMEKAYLEQHTRDYEVTQSFSLALLDPSALITLRETGNCTFKVPEILFDLFYPGQYKRIIKSVRLSIPCVAGPYTNISAKLTLLNSWLRKSDNLTTAPLNGSHTLDIARNTSISTSSAQNDAGMFELNFRDERYLPFEGAGAISEWQLELPSKIRLFDYDTISDVIIHISYTAKDDGAFKTTVENQIVGALTDFAAAVGLYRLLSLKHEFPNAFHRLLNPSGAGQTTEFEVTKQHFPYFLNDGDLKGKDLLISDVTVYLKPKGKDPVDTSGLRLSINGTNPISDRDWTTPMNPSLKEANVPSLSGSSLSIDAGTDGLSLTIDAGTDGLNKEELDDILILLKYTISSG